jgi:sec-independent protein translocase protein TatB
MFDISWTEFLLIGVVALIVIGPKELPAVLRTLGQYTRKVRSMAADFQGQFQEAMREAEMADLKQQVEDIATDIKQYDPLKDVRADVEAAGKDIKASLDQPALMTSRDAAIEETTAPELPAPACLATETDAVEPQTPELLAPASLATETDAVEPQTPESAAEPVTTRQAG